MIASGVVAIDKGISIVDGTDREGRWWCSGLSPTEIKVNARALVYAPLSSPASQPLFCTTYCAFRQPPLFSSAIAPHTYLSAYRSPPSLTTASPLTLRRSPATALNTSLLIRTTARDIPSSSYQSLFSPQDHASRSSFHHPPTIFSSGGGTATRLPPGTRQALCELSCRQRRWRLGFHTSSGRNNPRDSDGNACACIDSNRR